MGHNQNAAQAGQGTGRYSDARNPGRFLYLHNTGDRAPAFLSKVAGHKIEILFQYDAVDVDWSVFDAVIIPTHCDQRHLARNSAQLQNYLNGGGTLVINGHIETEFLPELTRFEPLAIRNLQNLVINRVADHPVFSGIDSETLTLRKGVAGFYGRGTNPPPSGAEILNTVSPDQLAVDWLYRRPSGGRIFCHSGNDFCGFFTSGSADSEQIIQRFYDWMAATSLKGEGRSRPLQAANQNAIPTAGLSQPPDPGRVAIGAIDGGLYYHHRSLFLPPFGRYFDEVVYVLDVPDTDLSRFDTLILPCRMNARLLEAIADQLQDYMRGGGRLVVMGETLPDRWLPDVSYIPRETNYWWWLNKGADLGVRIADPSHGLATYVSASDATWHLHGVFEPRTAAQKSLIETSENECLLFEDRETYAPGVLVATTLDPIYHHGSCFMPATTKFLTGFMEWLSQTTNTGKPNSLIDDKET